MYTFCRTRDWKGLLYPDVRLQVWAMRVVGAFGLTAAVKRCWLAALRATALREHSKNKD